MAVIGDGLTVSQAAEETGVARQTLHRRLMPAVVEAAEVEFHSRMCICARLMTRERTRGSAMGCAQHAA
jgi:predicted DNA-binding protein (UPF0251 family)